MTTYTLGGLKAKIADDLARSDLTTQIAEAISAAITHYKTERFWFTESRAAAFPTVAAQSAYTSSDDADIPLFFQRDGLHVEVSSTDERQLDWIEQTEMEWLLGNSPNSSVPQNYSFFNDTFYLYPVPDDAYTIRNIGGIEVDEPAAADTANNAWMTSGYALIRARAKAEIYAHTIKNISMAQTMSAIEDEALSHLNRKTSKKKATGRIRPTSF